MNGRAPEVDVSLCLTVHPPSLSLLLFSPATFKAKGMWRRLIEAEAEEEAAMQYAVHLHSTPIIINGLT